MRNEKSPPLNLVQFYEIRPTFKSWRFWSIWFSYHSSMIQTNYSRWKVGIWGWWKKKFNIWTCWIQKKLMVKFSHSISFTNKPQKKASYFLLSESSASQNPANFTFKTGDPFFSGYTFLAPIGHTCKSHVNVHGHSDKMYHQLMATQVKFPRKSLATEAAHAFMQDLH